ncbi:hypothetical protein JAAARDRAFT_34496 [Jaapia argillacea MUCL 33604]|uniref:5-formyltetrahydrofolate cyclo-ligase n=1 Tax=Jaapia argillacea MUCL 33604 TaxID=933084 RepID=A0A067Q7T1_9AGAM|nr:hypothetical protein JAAARDRAFT_34496 [Jaapia argillacea MUCL 33604]
MSQWLILHVVDNRDADIPPFSRTSIVPFSGFTMAATTPLRAQKKALRKALSATLSAVPTAEIQLQSQAITSHILSLPSFHAAKSISCYLSMPTGEVDTSSIVLEILRAGKALFVPKIHPPVPNSEPKMDFLKVYSEEDLRSFPAGLWGISEPGWEWKGKRRESALDEVSEPLDMILLPGVAFDPSLSRLGHGKGYYDRFITNCISSKVDVRRPSLVALSLREQILQSGVVPIGEHDWKMDAIITPDGVIQGDHVSKVE